VLRVLGVCAKEDVISNLLVYCFNHSKEFQKALLQLVGAKHSENYQWETEVRTRTTQGIPDILLICRHGNVAEVVIIENKITAQEGEDQTERYGSPKCLEDIEQKFELKNKRIIPRYIFLNLRDEEPKNRAFARVSYKNLAEALKALCFNSKNLTDKLLRDLLELLESYYSYSNACDEDNLLERLKNNDELDRSFQYFCSIFNNETVDFSKASPGLRVEAVMSSSYTGRSYLLARISKSQWHPEELRRKDKMYFAANPERCFNIHFEPTYEILNKKFGLVLHFETNPYLPRAQAEKQMKQNDYESYLLVREKFKNHIASYGIPNVEMTNRSNQILKFKFDIGDSSSLKNYKKCLMDCISPVIGPIDAFVK